MSNKKLFDELHHFFLKVNKVRTDVMRKENPNDSYEYFPKDEQPELVIRKGMSQYEDLAKKFRRMERKGGLKLTKESEPPQSLKESKQSTNIKTTKPKKEEKEEKEKISPKKRKTSDTKEEEKEKPSTKRRKTSGLKEEEKDIDKDKDKAPPKKRKTSGTKEDESKNKPIIIKRTVGTDNPITRVRRDANDEDKERVNEKEKEKEKVNEDKKETIKKKP